MDKVFIIAEAGVNHNGSFNIAKELVDTAKTAGVDAIKFQTFKAQNLVSKNADKANYQKANTGNSDKQIDMLKKLELSFEEFSSLKKYCDHLGIMFLSTPFDLESLEFLSTLDIPLFKIPSGEITNLPYLIKIAQTKKDVILSTGMCEIEEIREAIEVLKKYGTENISLLHCTTEYPTPFDEVNLNAMLTLKQTFNLNIGYSDHTQGIEVPVAAVAMGATIIEKHFTLDKNMDGPDHKASLNPQELMDMVSAIRNIEMAMGNGKKKPTKSEINNKKIARKSIVAVRNIKIGEVFTEDNITIKRPGDGISPMKWFDVLGKSASRDFQEDELIEI